MCDADTGPSAYLRPFNRTELRVYAHRSDWSGFDRRRVALTDIGTGHGREY